MNFILSAALLVCIVSTSNAQVLSPEEKKLYDAIMEYRRMKGLPGIPLSRSLTIVAQTHVKDLQDNNPATGACNLHSWSDRGAWTPCCYTSDHAQAEHMWLKPSQLTSYEGNGYEIAHWHSVRASASSALSGWIESPAHHAVMINKHMWTTPWKAIGIGIFKNYAVVWFGHEQDKAVGNTR